MKLGEKIMATESVWPYSCCRDC